MVTAPDAAVLYAGIEDVVPWNGTARGMLVDAHASCVGYESKNMQGHQALSLYCASSMDVNARPPGAHGREMILDYATWPRDRLLQNKAGVEARHAICCTCKV